MTNFGWDWNITGSRCVRKNTTNLPPKHFLSDVTFESIYLQRFLGKQVKRANKGLGTGRKDTFSHIHSPKLRVRDRAKCFDQWEKTRKRDRATGLRNVNYTLLSQVEMSVEDAHLTVLNVRLHCDRELTPWCQCPDPVNNNNTLSNNNNQPPRQHWRK